VLTGADPAAPPPPGPGAGRRRGRWIRGRRAGGLALVLALVVAAVVVVVLVRRGPSRPSTAAASAPAANGSTPAVGPSGPLKPVIRGLIDRQGPPPKAVLSAVHAYVVKVNWADLQPVAGGPIVADNAIDQAIARVEQPDYRAVGMVLKLRVFAGIGAPEWAKQLGGAPVPYINNQAGGSTPGGTIGRFWTAPFEQAYAALQTALAAKYDRVPQIREVTMSGCSTIFDEPFVRQFGDPANVAALEAAGYTTAADENCILAMVSAHQAWSSTTSDIDISPYPNIADPGGNRDLAFPESVMRTCRAELGLRCGLENNDISTQKLANRQYQQLYQAISALGSPVIFQTAAASRLGNEQQVLAAAVALHANSVELPQGYPAWPLTLLDTTSRGLVANPAR
jgi:hypothetical protein